MKYRILFSCLLMVVAILSGCAGPQPTEGVSAQPAIATQAPALALQTEVPTFTLDLPEGYDPSSEEDEGGLASGGVYSEKLEAVFAGATPLRIDPVDMPTPTPRPALAFTYVPYTAEKLGLSFESVAGYHVDSQASDTFILTEPEELQKDNYSVQILFMVTPVTSSYKVSDIQNDLKAKIDELGAYNYNEWRKYSIEASPLMGKDGYYTTYRGVLYDGTVVRGRVHMALLDNSRLLTLHLSCPGWFNTDYTGVFTHIRSTLKAL